MLTTSAKPSSAASWQTAEHPHLDLEVRADGCIRAPSADGTRLRVLRPFTIHGHPHVVVGLRQVRVAQLVLEAFRGGRIDPRHIRYADNDPTNCSLENLSYEPPTRGPGRPRKDPA